MLLGLEWRWGRWLQTVPVYPGGSQPPGSLTDMGYMVRKADSPEQTRSHLVMKQRPKGADCARWGV